LSPEFLESSHPILLADRDRILAAKSSLQIGEDIAIVENRCGTDSPRSYLPTHNFFSDLLLINIGNVQPILDALQNRIGVRFRTRPQPVPFSGGAQIRARNEVQTAIMVVTNTFARAVGGMKFDVQFSAGSNAALLVFVDRAFVCQINQRDTGTNLVNTGEVVFGRLFSRGMHTIAFHLVPDQAGSAEVVVQNVEIGYDPRPAFLQSATLPAATSY